jgi:hypothetical protein
MEHNKPVFLTYDERLNRLTELLNGLRKEIKTEEDKVDGISKFTDLMTQFLQEMGSGGSLPYGLLFTLYSFFVNEVSCELLMVKAEADSNMESTVTPSGWQKANCTQIILQALQGYGEVQQELFRMGMEFGIANPDDSEFEIEVTPLNE